MIALKGKTTYKRPSPNGPEDCPPPISSCPLGSTLCGVCPGYPTGTVIPGPDEVTKY